MHKIKLLSSAAVFGLVANVFLPIHSLKAMDDQETAAIGTSRSLGSQAIDSSEDSTPTAGAGAGAGVVRTQDEENKAQLDKILNENRKELERLEFEIRSLKGAQMMYARDIDEHPGGDVPNGRGNTINELQGFLTSTVRAIESLEKHRDELKLDIIKRKSLVDMFELAQLLSKQGVGSKESGSDGKTAESAGSSAAGTDSTATGAGAGGAGAVGAGAGSA